MTPGASHDGVHTSEAVTRGVRVHVTARYSPTRSEPLRNRWFFLYTIQITNEGPETVQLISRHWTITDGDNNLEEVRGPGVVGQQPTLEPGVELLDGADRVRVQQGQETIPDGPEEPFYFSATGI